MWQRYITLHIDDFNFVFNVSGAKSVGEACSEEPQLNVHGAGAEPGQAEVPERAAGASHSLERSL